VAEDGLFLGGGGVFPQMKWSVLNLITEGAIISRNSWILASSCGEDWGFLFLAISVSSFLVLILGIAKAATFVTA